jgi:hypothetical protein
MLAAKYLLRVQTAFTYSEGLQCGDIGLKQDFHQTSLLVTAFDILLFHGLGSGFVELLPKIPIGLDQAGSHQRSEETFLPHHDRQRRTVKILACVASAVCGRLGLKLHPSGSLSNSSD